VAWFGPVFWPYAYSDIFDYTFWPYGYDDGYWAYAYDDFFDSVFWGEEGPPEEYAYAVPRASTLRTPRYSAVQELCRQRPDCVCPPGADLGPAAASRLQNPTALGVAVADLPELGLAEATVVAYNEPAWDDAAWMQKQVYIALGTLLQGAALLGIDACPIEGFDAAKLDAELGLRERGYTAVVLAALGYRGAEDFNAKLPKSRFDEASVITTL